MGSVYLNKLKQFIYTCMLSQNIKQSEKLMEFLKQLQLIQTPNPYQKGHLLHYDYQLKLLAKFSATANLLGWTAIEQFCQQLKNEKQSSQNGKEQQKLVENSQLEKFFYKYKQNGIGTTVHIFVSNIFSQFAHLQSSKEQALACLSIFSDAQYQNLFSKKWKWDKADQSQYLRKQKISELVWINPQAFSISDKNTLYYTCLNELMLQMCQVQKPFDFTFVCYCLQFCYKHIDNLCKPKVLHLVTHLLKLVFNQLGSDKNFVKQINQKSIKDLKQSVDQIVKNMQCDKNLARVQIQNFKKSIEQCSNMIGLALLKNQSIQKRLVGLKLLSYTSIGDNQFYDWLITNEVLQIIFNQSNQDLFINNAGIIFKAALKCTKQNKTTLYNILSFASQSKPELRKRILKYIESVPFSQYYGIHDEVCLYFLSNGSYLLIQEAWDILLKFVNKINQKIHEQVLNYLINFYLSGEQKDQIANKCKTLITDLYLRQFDAKDKTAEQLNKKITQLYDLLLSQQINLKKLMLATSVTNKIMDSNKYSLRDMKQQIADLLVYQYKLAERILYWLGNNQFNPAFSSLQQCFMSLFSKATHKIKKNCMATFQIMKKAVKNLGIFKKLVSFFDVGQLKEQFKTFIQFCYSEENYNPCLIKSIRIYFIALNPNKITQANNSEDFSVGGRYPLEGQEDLLSCLMNANRKEARDELAELIADICTKFNEQMIQKGKQFLIQMFNECVQNFGEQYHLALQQNSNQKLLGWLALVKQLMMATQIQGVGNFQPHNSLVTTHYVTLEIVNSTKLHSNYHNREKKTYPANMILIDVVQQLCNSLQCDMYEFVLKVDGKIIPLKRYGLTLDQLHINNKQLTILSSQLTQLKMKQNICKNGILTQKSKKAFTQIFMQFAKDDRLGRKECKDFVNGVTKNNVRSCDELIDNFIHNYGNSQGYITLQSFFRFYQDKYMEGKQEDIWKNLNNMKYRYDLRKYSQPRDSLPQQLLFRSYLCKSSVVYETLIAAARSDDTQLKTRTIQILFHLPSYKKNYIAQPSLFYQGAQPFQILYVLIAIQHQLQLVSRLPDRQQKIKQFHQQNKSAEIFQVLRKLHQKQKISDCQQKCQLICIKILRFLSPIPDLRYKIYNYSIPHCQINFKLPKTMVFIQKICNAVLQKNVQLIQSLFALQILQIQQSSSQNIGISQAISVIFDKEEKIRQVACNFIYYLSILGKDISQVYKVQIGENCDTWYETQAKIIQSNESFQYEQALASSLKTLEKKRQEFQSFEDPAVHGSLLLILSIIKKKKISLTFQKMVNIANKIVMPSSRKLVYLILSHINLESTVFYLKQLTEEYQVQEQKQLSARNKYVGLNNLGCTCYINAVLQLLYWIKSFRNELVDLTTLKQSLFSETENDLLEQIQIIFQYLQNGYNKFYDMTKFCQVYRDKRAQPINVKLQEDAHQFYNHFLQVLQNLFVKCGKKEVFQKMMAGKTVSQYVCSECDNKFLRSQKFESLNLVVKGCSNLDQSLKKCITSEEIEDYFCENCNNKVKKITKFTSLSELPDYLIINLKRMDVDIEQYKNIKINTRFEFPQYLSLSDYISKCEEQEKSLHEYKLKAAIIHAGSAISGHYYSIINIEQKWYKFDDKHVSQCDPRQFENEAFGGQNSSDPHFKLDQQTFSTSAYMLCYQRCHHQQQKVEDKQKLNETLETKIIQEKQYILKQLKVCNDSIFELCLQLYQQIKPAGIAEAVNSNPYDINWKQNSKIDNYRLIYELSVISLKFLKKFWKVSDPFCIQNLGTQIIELLYLLPQMSYDFLNGTNQIQCRYMLCLHQDSTVRMAYKHILLKSLHIFFDFYGYHFDQDEPAVEHVKNIIESLKNFIDEKDIFQCIYSLDYYFQFWAVCTEYIRPVLTYMLKTNIFLKFLQILQIDSTASYSSQFKEMVGKQKPKSVPIKIASTLCTIIYLYVNCKFIQNTMIQNSSSDEQQKILKKAQFYSNIINNQYDNQKRLPTVINHFSTQNQAFSKQMAEIFLKGFKTYEERGYSLKIMLEYAGYFLTINDSLAQKRIKWLLGIPQLIIGDELTFGFSQKNLNCQLYRFTSTLYYSQFNKYPPLLEKFVNQNEPYAQNKFTIAGLVLLLNLANISEAFLTYLNLLPSPTHICRNYFDWLHFLVLKLPDMSDSCFDEERKFTQSSITQLYFKLKDKTKQRQLSTLATPLIIGTNYQVQPIFNARLHKFSFTVYSHDTYFLQSKPDGFKNQSTPSYFLFSQISNYFISKKSQRKGEPRKQMKQGNKFKHKKTVLTWIIEAQSPLRITLKVGGFNQEIYLQPGRSQINMPFQAIKINEESWSQFLQVDVLDQDEVTWSNRKFSYIQMEKPQAQQKQNLILILEDNRGKKSCSYCTFLNDIQIAQCQICLSKF